jgi:hypothetical protein
MSPQLQNGSPDEALYSCSKNGWITEGLFQRLHHFKQFDKLSKDEPVLVVPDNNASHISEIM